MTLSLEAVLAQRSTHATTTDADRRRILDHARRHAQKTVQAFAKYEPVALRRGTFSTRTANSSRYGDMLLSPDRQAKPPQRHVAAESTRAPVQRRRALSNPSAAAAPQLHADQPATQLRSGPRQRSHDLPTAPLAAQSKASYLGVTVNPLSPSPPQQQQPRRPPRVAAAPLASRPEQLAKSLPRRESQHVAKLSVAPASAPAADLKEPARAKTGTVYTTVRRAKAWDIEVENAYRLQEAGYAHLAELTSFGEPEPERHQNGFIKKLRTKKSVEAGAPVNFYFPHRRECADASLHLVKLYR